MMVVESVRLRYAQRFCLQRCACVVGGGRWAQTQKQLRLVIDGDGTVVFYSIERSCLLVASRSVAQWSVAQVGVHVQSPICIFFLAGIYDVNVEEGVLRVLYSCFMPICLLRHTIGSNVAPLSLASSGNDYEFLAFVLFALRSVT